jgi:hypothetical protein
MVPIMSSQPPFIAHLLMLIELTTILTPIIHPTIKVGKIINFKGISIITNEGVGKINHEIAAPPVTDKPARGSIAKFALLP